MNGQQNIKIKITAFGIVIILISAEEM